MRPPVAGGLIGWRLGRDLRDAARAVRRRPLPALVTIVSLSLGLGTTVALSSLVDGVLLAPLPVPEPDRLLYVVSTRAKEGGHYGVAYHNYMAWREADAFAAMTAYRGATRTLAGEAGGERLGVSEVAPSYFDTAGVAPALGRRFTAGDARRGERLAILSHSLWQRRFGGSDDVLGRAIALDGEPHTVVGVMPPGARTHFLAWRDLWTLLSVDEAAALVTPARGFSVLGRLRDGVTLETAERELRGIASRLAAERPETNEGWSAAMHPVRWWYLGDVERPLLVAFAVSLLVLLAACGTAANLQLAEVAARRRQAAVKKALGAPRWWLARGFLVESLLLTATAGVLGLGLAHLGLDLASTLLADRLPRLEPGSLSAGATTALAMVGMAAFLSGLAPALALARTPLEALRGRGAGDRGGQALRRLLVTVSVALAVVAVVGAALSIETVRRLAGVDPGFAPAGLLTARVELPGGDPERRQAMVEQLLSRLEALPGVAAAAVSSFGLPLVDATGTFELFVEGRPRRARPDVAVSARAVSSGFLEAMGIPLVGGRFFAPGETWESANAVVVSDATARRYWPGRDPLGRWVEWASGDRGTVVGVVGSVRSSTLAAEPGAEVYVAWGRPGRSQSLVVRSAGPDPASLASAVRGAVAGVLPGAAVYAVATGEEIVRDAYGDRRLWAWLLGLSAVLVIFLGAIGLYGVVAHWVIGREREIGVRMALGALPIAVVRRVLAQGMTPVAGGVALGVAAALVVVRYLESQLYGVAARDPATFVAAALGVAALAALVCAVPASRASRVDPAAVLRRES